MAAAETPASLEDKSSRRRQRPAVARQHDDKRCLGCKTDAENTHVETVGHRAADMCDIIAITCLAVSQTTY